MSVRSDGNSFTAVSIGPGFTQVGGTENTGLFGTASITLVSTLYGRLDVFRGPSEATMTVWHTESFNAGQKLSVTIQAIESYFRVEVVNQAPESAVLNLETYYYEGIIPTDLGCMCLGDDALQHQMRSDNSGNLISHPQGQYLQTPFVLGDTASTILQLDQNGHLKTVERHTSVGQDVIASGDGLQQVLMYGRKNDGTLQPLETSGDRLLVDVVELAGSGPISNSTALASMQVCGIDPVSARFKTLQVDGDGVLSVSHTTSKTTTNHLAQSLAGDSFWVSKIDCSAHKKLAVAVSSNATSGLLLYGSDAENGTYNPMFSILVTNEVTGPATSQNIAYAVVNNPPKFVQIKNIDAGGVVLDLLITLDI